MTREEAIELLCAYGVPQDENKFQEALDMAIKALEQEPCEDYISRERLLNEIKLMRNANPSYWYTGDMVDREELIDCINDLPSVQPKPKLFIKAKDVDTEELEKLLENPPRIQVVPETGKWSRKTKVDAYDLAGVKTWGIKCQCSRCTFTTIVVEDFGYYKYCPNCGAKMEGVEE